MAVQSAELVGQTTSGHILVAATEQSRLMRFKRLMRRVSQATIISANNLLQISDAVAESEPNLILLDLAVSPSICLGMLEQMSERRLDQFCPLLVIVDAANRTIKRQVLLMETADVVTEPIDAAELALRARRLLRFSLNQRRLHAENQALHDDLRVRTQEMETSEALLSQAYAGMTCGVIVRDAKGVLISANAAAENLLGTTRAELAACGPTGRPYSFEKLDGTRIPENDSPTSRALHTGRPQRDTLVIIRRDGERRVVQSDAIPQHNADGALARVVVSFVDVSERVATEAGLRDQATHDALTGLYNRVGLLNRLTVAASKIEGCALLLLDLDGFKEVNDTLGHHMGDQLLVSVATRMRASVRATDTVARLGGDEFAIVLPAASADSAVTVARAIGAAIAAPVSITGQTLCVQVSSGIALAPLHGCDANTLLQKADEAMYAAKRLRCGYVLHEGCVRVSVAGAGVHSAFPRSPGQ